MSAEPASSALGEQLLEHARYGETEESKWPTASCWPTCTSECVHSIGPVLTLRACLSQCLRRSKKLLNARLRSILSRSMDALRFIMQARMETLR